MRLIKAVFVFMVFLVIAVGFFALIRFEISYGVAGGKFGGAEVSDSPGTFWFLIEIQVLMGLYALVNAIKELWDFSRRNRQEADRMPPANMIAIYWLVVTFFVLVLSLLAMWSAFDMAHHAYNLLDEFEMPQKAIFAGMFLMVFGVFGFVVYQFIIGSLIGTLFSKARTSVQVLRHFKKN
jgi:hypothetical protein